MKTFPLLRMAMALVCIDAFAANELALQRLVTFSASDEEPQPHSFIQGSDGHFYGTTSADSLLIALYSGCLLVGRSRR